MQNSDADCSNTAFTVPRLTLVLKSYIAQSGARDIRNAPAKLLKMMNKTGSGRGTRTPDPRIMIPVL